MEKRTEKCQKFLKHRKRLKGAACPAAPDASSVWKSAVRKETKWEGK